MKNANQILKTIVLSGMRKFSLFIASVDTYSNHIVAVGWIILHYNSISEMANIICILILLMYVCIFIIAKFSQNILWFT